ncbi:MAG TPA: TfoX/Sxy family protein [Actinoplanes sp.]|nr:TfoX/Sxy family protein [Actinoplanes sp.]
MAYDQVLADRVRDRLADAPGVTGRPMFGGLVFLEHGAMTVAVTGADLMVRVGKAGAADALAQPGVRPSEIGGRPMGGWVVVDGAVLDDEALSGWIDRARTFVATLPPK